MIRIKLVATPDDIKESILLELHTLDTMCFPNDDPYPKRGSYWWIAYEGSIPVGFAGLRPYPATGEGFLCRVGVLRRARKQGLQRRFIRVREKKAREIGLGWLVTYTLLNPASIKSLVDCKYQIYKPQYMYAGYSLYFRKQL